MRKLLIFKIALLLICDLSAQQEVSRVGTSGAQFLKLGVGARACALGETMVAIRGDITNLYWNPAGLASLNNKMLAVSRNQLYVNLTYHFLGMALPLANESVIGLSVLYFDSGAMEVTTVDEPEGTGRYFSWQSTCLGISYARFLTDRLSLGATVKYILESVYTERANGLAFDLGALLDTGILGFRLGLSMSNIGEDMRFSSPSAPQYGEYVSGIQEIIAQKFQLKTKSFSLPLTFRLGLAADLMGDNSKIKHNEKNRLTLAVDANDPNDEFLRSNFGLEYEWNKIFAFRCGYRGLPIESNPLKEYSTSSYSVGAGLKYDIDFLHLQFDYAFVDYRLLGNAHHFTLSLQF